MIDLLWFLLVPCVVAGLVWVAAAVYRRYKDSQLSADGALDAVLDGSDQTDSIGDEWKGPVEQVLQPAQVADAMVHFDKLLKEESKDVKRFSIWSTEREADPAKYEKGEYEYALAYNRARDRMIDWLRDKRLTHPTGNQIYDFFAANPAMKVAQYDTKHEGESALRRYLRVNNLSEPAAVRALTNYFHSLTRPKMSDLESTVLAETIRHNAAEKAVKEASLRMRQEFLEQLKAVQKNIEDDAFAAKVVLDEKVRLEQEVETLKKRLVEVPVSVSVPYSYTVETVYNTAKKKSSAVGRTDAKGTKRVVRTSKRRKK